jgi:hypothetical protein
MVVAGCVSACARVDGCARVEETDYDYQWPSLVNRRGGSSDVFSFCGLARYSFDTTKKIWTETS